MVTERLKVNKENLTSLGKRPNQSRDRPDSLSRSLSVRSARTHVLTCKLAVGALDSGQNPYSSRLTGFSRVFFNSMRN